MVYEYRSYRSFLKDVLNERKARNKSYSLRAFARALRVAQPALSQVFAGKKNFSSETALKIGPTLGLNEKETEYFNLLVQLEAAKGPLAKKGIQKKLEELKPVERVEMDAPSFAKISDWYYLVIRHLTQLDEGDLDPRNVARRLEISVGQAKDAIARLVSLDLIRPSVDRPHIYRKGRDFFVAQSKVRSEALRNFHRQMLEQALQSLHTQTPQQKIVGSETFAFAEEHLELAREISEEFFQKMTKLADLPGKKTEVFHLGVQFFSVTRGKTGRGVTS